ncbi:ABC transporter ATP-binding protein [Psychromonas hadalis]|uniref:ABC transporter ATP-binding protein n=1 Tax=Psychromonas hadalis TaxID=211669 RepID=UPI0003B2F382|nr:ABC transporter ATP-binding protein [Psychromonas hadalis]
MSKICFKNFSFSYAGTSQKAPTLRNINLSINAGQCVLLTGSSGSGKSTLIRAINGLVPNFFHGELKGSLCLDGIEVATIPEKKLYRTIATVSQNPCSQFFTNSVGSELVFSAENFALNITHINHLLSQNLSLFQLEGREYERLDKLSSGEKQRVACASASFIQPELILLDEPSANLDAKAAKMLANAIASWKKLGITVIVAEHRSAYLGNLVDRQIHLEHGRIIETAPIHSAATQAATEKRPSPLKATATTSDTWLLKSRARWFGIADKNARQYTIAKSSVIAVSGENGAGKSSLFRQLCGLEKGPLQLCDAQGRLNTKALRQRCFFVDQEVNRQLLCDSVSDEVQLNMPGENEQLAMSILSELDLIALKDDHPLAISGGQKQRLALATAVAANREFTVLDEPTSGLDSKNVTRVVKQITKMRDRGCTVIVISHDPAVLLACCDSVIHIRNRQIEQMYDLDDRGQERLLSYMQFSDVSEPPHATEVAAYESSTLPISQA